MGSSETTAEPSPRRPTVSVTDAAQVDEVLATTRAVRRRLDLSARSTTSCSSTASTSPNKHPPLARSLEPDEA